MRSVIFILLVVLLLSVPFAPPLQAQEEEQIRLYTAEEVMAVLCKGEDAARLWDLPEAPLFRNLDDWPKGLYRSVGTTLEGELPRVVRIEFNESIHPIARSIIEEVFAGFRWDPAGEILIIEKACGYPTPLHYNVGRTVAQRLGWDIRPEKRGTTPSWPLIVTKTMNGSMVLKSRGAMLARGILGEGIMRMSDSLRTAIKVVRAVLESGKRPPLCFRVVGLNPARDVAWIWRGIIRDSAEWRIVDCPPHLM